MGILRVETIASWLCLLSEFLQQDEGEDSEDEGDNEADEKITRNWSVLKSNPELHKSKVI